METGNSTRANFTWIFLPKHVFVGSLGLSCSVTPMKPMKLAHPRTIHAVFPVFSLHVSGIYLSFCLTTPDDSENTTHLCGGGSWRSFLLSVLMLGGLPASRGGGALTTALTLVPAPAPALPGCLGLAGGLPPSG